jgi:hypothetical protein
MCVCVPMTIVLRNRSLLFLFFFLLLLLLPAIVMAMLSRKPPTARAVKATPMNRLPSSQIWMQF